MSKIPTDEAWEYFMKHHDNIRNCISEYGTRKYSPHGSEELEPIDMEEWDNAVKEKASVELFNLMNDAWYRAPDDRRIYRVPGFIEMCNILDESIKGFIEEPEEE